jgi:MraZ protein
VGNLKISNMLLGEYTHTLDDKKRIILPKKFKDTLGKKVVITRGLDNCLFLYSDKEWADIAKRLRELSFAQADTRGFNRFMFSGAVEVDVDGTGRILIPEHLKKFAALKTKVVVTGVSDRVEIWDEKRWAAYQERIEKQGDAMAEKLGEIGVL